MLQSLCCTPASAATYAETTGGLAHTWTNYTNAGGTQGPSIASFQTVQITCALTGSGSLTAIRGGIRLPRRRGTTSITCQLTPSTNNGQTSGSLIGTPFVDQPYQPARADGWTSETTGGNANTWTNYTNAGGTQGPTIASHQTVQIACALQGFRVADGNTGGIGSLRHRGQISITSQPTPSITMGKPAAVSSERRSSILRSPCARQAAECGGAGSTAETPGGAANTWTNYSNAGGTQGATIASHQTVQIACKLTGFRVADGKHLVYQIASSPWNNGFYVSADAFYNNGATSGSLIGTPFVDPRYPTVRYQARLGRPARPQAVDQHVRQLLARRASRTDHPRFHDRLGCVSGHRFSVADGNTWWYLIASSPWNSVAYASADAFYNNGQTMAA